MKDWRDKRMIDYLEGFNAELPQSDWDDFLSRKAVHDLATRRRRRFLTAAISIPAAAAVLLLLFLLPINRTPAGQTTQNNPHSPQEEQMATTDSISNPVDSVKLGGILAEPELIENKVAMTPSITPVRMSNDTVSFNHDTYRHQVDTMLARNNKTKEELDSITADMMERVTAYEQTKETENPNMTFGGLGGFGGFGGLGGATGKSLAQNKANTTYGSRLGSHDPAAHPSGNTSVSNTGQTGETASVTFHVEDLAPISQNLYPMPASKLIDNMITNQEYSSAMVRRKEQLEHVLLQQSSAIVPGKKYLNGVIKTSLGDENLVNCDFNTFSKGMMQAFAYHRPVVLSPDMIWLLISQAFAHHINLNADELRDRIVEHEGKMLLTAVSDVDLLADPDHVDWNYIFTDFENMISANTKNGIAELVTADFSTTGPTEKIASQITLMESVKSYFEYEVMYTVCGIPDVTLLGTPDDWRKVRQKASRLSGYGLDWWIEELDPVLEQFVRASEGDVDIEFWQGMVKKRRPGEVRFASCQPFDDSVTQFDGWFLKFYPYDMNGRTPDKIAFHHQMLPEMVKTPFRYRVVDKFGGIIADYEMELWAGFFGLSENPENGALTPSIGWMVRHIMTENDLYKTYLEINNRHETIKIQSDFGVLPECLKRFNHIYSLEIDMGLSLWDFPEWFNDIKIDKLKIKGVVLDRFDEKRLKGFRKKYPDAEFDITIQKLDNN